MKRDALTSRRVVDLLRYKQERRQARLDFEPSSQPRPALAPVTPFRPLTAREIEHRTQMLRHLMR